MASNRISDILIDASKYSHVSFHAPGHKERQGVYQKAGFGDFLKHMIAEDINKLPGSDSLFCPHSSINETMKFYAALYSSRKSFLLVNGSSAGVMAAVLASTSRGGKLILGRDSHHCAFSAMRMGNLTPVYLDSELDEEHEIELNISPETLELACEENSDAEAVLITSPNKYGVVADVKKLAEIAHSHGMNLIVDQAEGAHLMFFDKLGVYSENGEGAETLVMSAENLGADIVVNGIHETLLSFTGSSILNICTEYVDVDLVEEWLRMLQTTSPSYLQIGSLDINARIMNRWGADMVKSWAKDLAWFYNAADKVRGLKVLKLDSMQDMTKLIISMYAIGLSGAQLERELMYKGIIVEKVLGNYLMLKTGAGNIRADYESLIKALKEISSNFPLERTMDKQNKPIESFAMQTTSLPIEKELVPFYKADGRVAHDPVTVYPPGVQLICPGEILSMEAISYAARIMADGAQISGLDEDGCIYVGV